jgi:hypothetical protein
MEYLIFGNLFYYNLFLNKHVKINKRNIEGITKFVQYLFDSFLKPWLAKSCIRTKPNTFLAHQTWLIIRVSTCGFLDYCKAVLNHPTTNDDIFICILHSNSSSLESLFGQISIQNHHKLTIS